MKKLAVVLALAVSGFVNSQGFNMKDVKHRPIQFSTHDSSFPVQLKEFDSIIALPVTESVKEELLETFINKRYGEILGTRYSLDAIVICITNKDAALKITDHDYVNPNSPDFFSTELNGYYATCLGNIEKCFLMGILLQEIKDVMVVNNTPSLYEPLLDDESVEDLIDYNATFLYSTPNEK
jgi:hypothetical protein